MLPLAGLFSSTGDSTVIRLSFIFRISCTRDWYVHECDSMGIRSTFRSRMMSTGLDDGVPVAVDGRLLDAENKLSFEFKIWSRNFRSSFADIISAAAPLGHRMIGITPSRVSHMQHIDYQGEFTHCNHDTE